MSAPLQMLALYDAGTFIVCTYFGVIAVAVVWLARRARSYQDQPNRIRPMADVDLHTATPRVPSSSSSPRGAAAPSSGMEL